MFQLCDPGFVPVNERNHVDVYLVPSPVSGGYPCYAQDPDEDGSPDPLYDEWRHNSVKVNDSGGNSAANPDSTLWPAKAASGVVHEFAHACWSSNSSTYGRHYKETHRADYNELLACGSGYLAKRQPETLEQDVCYAYSILCDRGNCYDPTQATSPKGQRYKLWAIFSAYLGHRFHDESSIGGSLLSQWAQNLTDRNGNVRMERTFCGLAEILGGASYDWLGDAPPGGYGDGVYRVNKVFSDYGIARWLNSPEITNPSNPDDKPYYFGPDYSPSVSIKQFHKVDADTDAIWEYAIPPEFVLDLGDFNVWTEYPDTTVGSVCDTGWYDVARGAAFNHDCVPMQADLWGSNYLVFRADTDIYNGPSWNDTLVVEFDWAGNMNPHVELWMSVLTYPVSHDSLFLDRYTNGSVDTTVVYDSSTSGATVRVPDFKEDYNEAAVIVLTVASTTDAIDLDPEYGCLRRMTYDGEPRVDLRYSYRFQVAGTHEPGGGCPFVASLGPNGYTEDNNVLARAPDAEGEILDLYLLTEKPEAVLDQYELRVSEDETEHSRFDAVGLIAADHSPDLGVAVLPDGSIGSYSVTAPPTACYDPQGRDLLDYVLSPDGTSAMLEGGSWLELHFPASAVERGGGGAGGKGNPSHKIDPPGGGGGRGARSDGLDLTELCYRANPATSILELPDGLVIEGDVAKMRVTAPVDFFLDYMFLADFVSGQVTVQACPLLGAYHSEDGPCGSALTSGGSYVGLDPGESIELTFGAPPLAPGDERDFVLLARGHFGESASRTDGGAAEYEAAVPRSTIAPNPFVAATTIRFEIPQPGGMVGARIYNTAGRLVRDLAREEMEPGVHELDWNGRDDQGERVSSGVYFCRIVGPGIDQQRKVVFLK